MRGEGIYEWGGRVVLSQWGVGGLREGRKLKGWAGVALGDRGSSRPS